MQIIKIFILLTLICFQTTAIAGTIVGAGFEGRMVKDDESNFVMHFPILVFAGYRENPWVFFGEFGYVQQKTSSGTSFTITTNHYELEAYALRFLSYEDGRVVNPYLIGGVGAMQDSVTQTFGSLTDKNNSQVYGNLKAGVGLWSQFLSHGFAMIDLRAMYSADYTPQVIFGLSFRLGYEF